jgi:hypothetical protein
LCRDQLKNDFSRLKPVFVTAGAGYYWFIVESHVPSSAEHTKHKRCFEPSVSYEVTNERGTRQKVPLVEYGGDNPAGVRFA